MGIHTKVAPHAAPPSCVEGYIVRMIYAIVYLFKNTGKCVCVSLDKIKRLERTCVCAYHMVKSA